MPKDAGGERTDSRRLAEEFERRRIHEDWPTRPTSRALSAAATPPHRILGLFHSTHLPVAFDKVGAGRYSDELARPANADYRDTPMLEDLARLALRSLSAHSPRGFYLMVEGASIDKRAHAVDAERMIWDVIEFDRAVQVALDFARRTNTDRDPANDTLVIVAADHETGGLGIIGVGNERYAPEVLGKAVRDYAAVFRFVPEQELNFFPNYQVDERGYPIDPDPSRKILLGWAAGPDRNENWMSNRLQQEAAVADGKPAVSVANPARDGPATTSDNKTARARRFPGFSSAARSRTARRRARRPQDVPATRRRSATPSRGTRRPTCRSRPRVPARGSSPASTRTRDVFLKCSVRRAAATSLPAAAPPPSVPGNRGAGRRP